MRVRVVSQSQWVAEIAGNPNQTELVRLELQTESTVASEKPEAVLHLLKRNESE